MKDNLWLKNIDFSYIHYYKNQFTELYVEKGQISIDPKMNKTD